MAYMVRQSIMDSEQNVLGYEIRYCDDNLNASDDDNAAANAVSNILTQAVNTDITGDKPIFLDFTWNLLEKKVPEMFNSDKLIMMVDDSIIIDTNSKNTLLEYRKLGYKIAIVDFQFMPTYLGILDDVDYIRLNFKFNNTQSYDSIISIAKKFEKKIIGYDIETKEAYDKAAQLGCDYFEGSFVSEKLPTAIKKTEFLQDNFYLLMSAVTKSEINYTEVSEIISRDVNLTFALLKLVNSAFFALRNKVTTVKQALMVLGIGHIKQWIYLLSFRQGDGSMPDELIKLSFLRATFAQELSRYAKDLPIDHNEAYLLGMFSTLGQLTQAPLEEVLKDIPVSKNIKNALISGEGRCGLLYNVIISYEKANWSSMKEYANELSIPNDKILQIYFDCVEKVNKIWDGIMHTDDNL